MEKLKNKLIRFLLAISCLLLVIAACKRKKSEALEPFAKVTLDANPDANPLLDSANLEYYVYNTEQGFKDAALAPVPSNFLLSGTVKGGKIEIPQLPIGSDYYVLVRFYDTKTFPKFPILYTNEESTFLISALEKQAEMEANVKLKPQEGLFTFYSKSTANLLPITITVGKENASIPDVGTNQTIKLRKGTYPVKGTNAVCAWMKTAKVEAGKNTLVEFETCEYGQVSFYTAQGSAKGIKVYLGAGLDNLIGEIKNPSSGTTCADPNAAHTLLAPGQYSYYAFEEGTKCAWSGTFSLKNGECFKEELVCE